MKICKQCNNSKPFKDFHVKRQSNKNKNGEVVYSHTYEPYCKICKNKKSKEYRTRTPEIIERIRAYQKQYHKHY